MIPAIKIIGSALKAGARSFPLGNAIIRTVETLKGGPLKKVATVTGQEVEGRVKDPHAWLKIILEVAFAGVIVYGFVTKQISLDRFIEIINGL